LVLIDEPEVNVYGGVVAAPAFRNIAQAALRHLAVAPQQAALIPVLPSQPEALGRRVAKPNSPATVETNGDAAPDFVGLSLREALEKAQTLKLRVRLQGNGYVVKQSPQAGGRWNEESVLVLNLQG
jgi:cell division protein FtsI (penicillin-binding protein 3)